MSQISPKLPTALRSGPRSLAMNRPLVMGILNLTPDSFFDGGKYALSEAVAVNRVKEMVLQGADMIDIGAASSRPGAELIDPIVEQERILPFFTIIRKTFPELWISIDTYHSSTAHICLKEGADMINDISGGRIDPRIFHVVAEFQCPYILMHMQGTPGNMQKDPHYENVTEEIISFFIERISALEHAGVKDILLDPGFGFGKSVDHNFEILKNLNTFKERCKLPVLVGISRKSMINKIIGTKPEEALNGTTAVHMLALLNGASVLRVHDVKEAKETIQLFEKYKSLS